MPDAGPIELKDILAEEYHALRPGTDFASGGTHELFAKVQREPQSFSALCISGGGVRSATFALGAIQGLAQHGVLQSFDYLSTVSGGGFIGSWLTAWSSRAGGLQNVIPRLRPAAHPAEPAAPPSPGTPDPIAHLRDYNSYMSPRVGLLSGDTWTLAATIVRNLLLIWIVLLPLLIAMLMLPRLYLSLLVLPEWLFGAIIFAGSPPGAPNYGSPELDAVSHAWVVQYGLPLFSGALFAIALFNTLRYLPGLGNLDHTRAEYMVKVLLPLVGAVLAYIAFDSLYYLGSGFSGQGSLGRQVLAALVPSAWAWLAYLLVARRRSARSGKLFSPLALAIFLMAAGTGLSIWVTANFLLWSPNPDAAMSWSEYVTVGPPAILMGYVLGTVLFVGLSSNMLKDEDREWMSRSLAGMLMFCALWLFACGTVLIAPKWVVDWQSWVPRVLAAVGVLSAWASAFGGTMVARRAPSGSRNPGKVWSAAALAVQVAPLVFIVVLAIALTLAANLVLSAAHLLPGIGGLPQMSLSAVSGERVAWDDHNAMLARAHPFIIVLVVVALLLLSRVLARFVNVNTFSLHAMYRDRLVRAYLGASNPKRNANKFTGFARKDDFAMHTLDPTQKPLHVVNLTLNLVQANRLAWQQRKAQPFTVSPLHCGNFELGYRASSQYGGKGGITLGTAAAISGAAASPSMGSYSSPAAGFIMTLLNARLGSWLGNPGVAGNRTWKHAGPRSPILCLVKEALGLTSNQTPYVYLSDGGHFENLGLYEMVLRRCQCIVAIDAGGDPDFDLAGLGNALRKIRIDLAIPIAFGDAAMGAMRKHKRRCAVATIGYSAIDKRARDGSLIYIKPMLRGNESPDVANYGHTHPDFPHQGTAEQWFDESQTESYRMLGLQTVTEMCAGWQGGSMEDFVDHVKNMYLGEKPEIPKTDVRFGGGLPV